MPAFKPKILIVDDEQESRSALARILKAKGFDVLEAKTGKEVLSRAKAEWPSLIVLDVVLPDISGTKVFEQLKADPVTKAIPILLLTAKPDAAQEIAAVRDKTSTRHFEKPGRMEDLLNTIQQMITGK